MAVATAYMGLLHLLIYDKRDDFQMATLRISEPG